MEEQFLFNSWKAQLDTITTSNGYKCKRHYTSMKNKENTRHKPSIGTPRNQEQLLTRFFSWLGNTGGKTQKTQFISHLPPFLPLFFLREQHFNISIKANGNLTWKRCVNPIHGFFFNKSCGNIRCCRNNLKQTKIVRVIQFIGMQFGLKSYAWFHILTDLKYVESIVLMIWQQRRNKMGFAVSSSVLTLEFISWGQRLWKAFKLFSLQDLQMKIWAKSIICV